MSRVCILTSVHQAFDIRIFHKQARSLVEAGYEVTLVTQEGESGIAQGVQILALPEPANRLQRMLGTGRLLQVAVRQQADVYHFHDPELIPAGLLLKLWTGRPVIYDVHEDYARFIRIKYWIPKSVRTITAGAFWMLEHVACLFFAAIIPANDEIARSFRLYGRKVVLVKNYPWSIEISPRQRPLGAGEQAVLIYACALTTAAGIPQVVQALAQVDRRFDAHFRILGRFAEDGCRELLEASDQAGRVEYLGWRSHPEVLEHLNNADIGMLCYQPLPEYDTAEPNKLFEYVRSGLPVVASDFPHWRTMIEGEGCGLVTDPRDPASIGLAINELLADPERMQAMGENGRRAVRERYNWDSQKAKLLRTYSDLVGRTTASLRRHKAGSD